MISHHLDKKENKYHLRNYSSRVDTFYYKSGSTTTDYETVDKTTIGFDSIRVRRLLDTKTNNCKKDSITLRIDKNKENFFLVFAKKCINEV